MPCRVVENDEDSIHIYKALSRGGSAYERGGDARRKFWIKLLKETNLGVVQPFFDPKRDHLKLSLHESSK